jgi:CubicO group peptidase (beta-lactamase class C family)
MSEMHIRGTAVRPTHPRGRALAAAFAFTCAVAPTIAAQASPDLAAFDRYVARAAHDWRIPGMAIAVVKDDSLVFANGYGVIEIGKPAPATEHTRFAIGSTTKAMTSAALAMLVDEGKLKWDDHVIDYLPDLRLYDPYATRELTVRDLLTHRTGLPGTDLLWAVPENSYSMPEMIRRLRYVKPSSSFRSHWEYQNVVYAIGGLLVERLSGMPWETFVRTRIFAPLQMTETIPLVSELKSKPNVAVPHDLTNDTVHVVAVRTTDAIASAGSVWSSVSDMSKWMRFILDSGRVGTKRLIRPETFAELLTPQMRAPMEEYPALTLARPLFFSYALGWFVQEYHGHTIWMHTGSIDGMCAIIGLMPDRHLGVYVLENLDHAELRHALMYKVFDLYTASARDSVRDWSADVKTLFAGKRAAAAAAAAAAPKPPAGTHPSLPLDRYAGTYADSTYGTVTVTLANGTLRARFGNWDIGDLQPASYDGFRSRKTDPLQGITDVTFIPDGAGHISAVQLFGQAFPRAIPSDAK